MKSILSTKIVALLLFVSLCSFKCKTDDVIEINPEDLAAPEITIITPNENATFYTDGGMDSPDYLILQANATDASTIIRGSVTVKAGAQAATTIAGLNDVDASSVTDGSILMFNSATSKFTTTNSIEPQTGGTITINGGNF